MRGCASKPRQPIADGGSPRSRVTNHARGYPGGSAEEHERSQPREAVADGERRDRDRHQEGEHEAVHDPFERLRAQQLQPPDPEFLRGHLDHEHVAQPERQGHVRRLPEDYAREGPSRRH